MPLLAQLFDCSWFLNFVSFSLHFTVNLFAAAAGAEQLQEEATS